MTAKYSGSLTGEPIMLHETRLVAKKLLDGQSEQEIKEELIESNEFGYKTKKSIPKRLSAIFRRLKKLDNDLLRIIVEDLSGDGKVIVVYAIALENRLFGELISEIISKRLVIKDFEFPRTEIFNFITNKGELNEQIGSFKDYTKYRLSLSMFNILKKAGIITIKDKKPLLRPIIISYSLKNILNKEKDAIFLKNLGVML
jgi:hypothetical protein